MRLSGLIGASALAMAAMSGGAFAQDVSACLITKTETNPFFVKMREGAQQAAEENGIDLATYAGKFDTDFETQIAAIETCIANGTNGILITPAIPDALITAAESAREAGILVIALDTPFDPIDAADMTFATDNFEAGRLAGAWARRRWAKRLRQTPRSPRSTSTRLSRQSVFCATRALWKVLASNWR